MNKFVVIGTAVVLTVLLFAGAVSAQDIPIDEVSKISVEGNDYVSDFEILNAVITEVGDRTNQETLRSDMQAVYNLGYFSDVSISFKSHEGGLHVIFEVVENPVLEDIQITGNEKIYSREKILDILDLETGSVLNVKKMNENLKKLQKQMQDDGYVLASYKNVNVSDQGVLNIDIAPGYLNSISVTGNTKTDEEIILRKMPVESGEIVDISRVQKGFQELSKLGYFESINPQLERVDSKENLADLIIDVTEGRTGTLQFGGGYSSADGWIGFIDVSERNLFGNGQNLGLRWQFGDTTTYSLNFYEPYLFESYYSLGFSVYDRETERTTSGGYDYIKESTGGSISVGHPLPRDWSTSLRYRMEDTKEYWDEDIAASTLNAEEGDLIEDSDYDLRSLTLSLDRDSSNARYHPTSGSINDFSIEQAGGALGGTMDFTKFTWDSRRYFPGFKNHAWALRMKLGLSEPRTSSGGLEGEEFDLGGSDTLRGYERSDFDDQDEDNNNLLLFNLEYRIPFNDNITGVVFTDAGNVWEERDQITADDLYYGYGLGMRMNTPVGQLRLDYGWDEDSEGRLHFSIGNTF